MKLQKIAGLGMLMSAAIGILGVSSAQAQLTVTGTGIAAGDGENVAASATFNNVGGHLVLTLINTYTGSTFGNADTLTGVFFNGARSTALPPRGVPSASSCPKRDRQLKRLRRRCGMTWSPVSASTQDSTDDGVAWCWNLS